MEPPVSRNSVRLAMVTAFFSAIILILALYSAGPELAIGEPNDSATNQLRYASSEPNSVHQFPEVKPAVVASFPHFDVRSEEQKIAELAGEQKTLEESLPVSELPDVSNGVGYTEVASESGLVPLNTSAAFLGPALEQDAAVFASLESRPKNSLQPKAASTVSQLSDAGEQTFLVRFDFDSWELNEDSVLTIQRAIRAIKDRYEGVALVAGYSGPRGSTAYNLELSRKRAQAVADSLLARGVSQERLRVEGRGTYAAFDISAAEGTPALGRIAKIIMEESSE